MSSMSCRVREPIENATESTFYLSGTSHCWFNALDMVNICILVSLSLRKYLALLSQRHKCHFVSLWTVDSKDL